MVVVEERPPPPHKIVKRFGCTTVHNKALYKCIINSLRKKGVEGHYKERRSYLRTQ